MLQDKIKYSSHEQSQEDNEIRTLSLVVKDLIRKQLDQISKPESVYIHTSVLLRLAISRGFPCTLGLYLELSHETNCLITDASSSILWPGPVLINGQNLEGSSGACPPKYQNREPISTLSTLVSCFKSFSVWCLFSICLNLLSFL